MAAARLTALSILGSLQRALGDLDRVTHWTRVFGMVNSAPGFNRQPSVINGFSELILELFGPQEVNPDYLFDVWGGLDAVRAPENPRTNYVHMRFPTAWGGEDGERAGEDDAEPCCHIACPPHGTGVGQL